MTRSRPALLLTTLLHVALLAALLSRQHAGNPVHNADREAITWILPAPPKASPAPATVPAQTRAAAVHRKQPASPAPAAITKPHTTPPASAPARSAESTAGAEARPDAAGAAADSEPVIGDLSALSLIHI